MVINDVMNVFFGKPPPAISNMRMGLDDALLVGGLTRGTLVIGKPGSGKTRYVAWLIIKYMLAYPQLAVLILDASGALKKDILAITMRLSNDRQNAILERLVIDIPGHTEYVHTMPEFHQEYGIALEKQVQRVAENIRRLNSQTMELGMLGKPALEEMAPELFRLICGIRDDQGNNWQITEAKKLLTDETQLMNALKKFGGRVPEAKYYFEQFSKMQVKAHEREMRSYTLRSALGVIEPREIRARVGGSRPCWTPEEMIRRGLCVIVSGERLLDQEPQLNYVFSQVYSLLRQEINKRIPDNPKDNPVFFVVDEAPVLYRVPGMAQELGELSTFYRSRKLQLAIIIQSLCQVTPELQGQLWSMGNKLVFSVEDMDDAQRIAEHLFYYSSTMVKQPPRTPFQNPTTESDRGQYRIFANWLHSLPPRACVVRRYKSESAPDPYIRYYPHIENIRAAENREAIEYLSERIFKSRALPIKDVIEVINGRRLVSEKVKPAQQEG